MSNNIKIIVKIVVAIIIYLILSTTMNYYGTMIGANIAVGQLEDSYSSSANMKIWKNVEDNWFVAYIIMVVLLFAGNIKNLLIKNKK